MVRVLQEAYPYMGEAWDRAQGRGQRGEGAGPCFPTRSHAAQLTSHHQVDVTENKALGRRFGVEGFPTLIMFSHGKMVEYDGDRSLESLVAFARGGFEESQVRSLLRRVSGAAFTRIDACTRPQAERVPAPPTAFQEVLRHVDGTAQNLLKSLGFWPFFAIAAGVAAAVGFLFGVAVMLFGGSPAAVPTKEKVT